MFIFAIENSVLSNKSYRVRFAKNHQQITMKSILKYYLDISFFSSLILSMSGGYVSYLLTEITAGHINNIISNLLNMFILLEENDLLIYSWCIAFFINMSILLANGIIINYIRNSEFAMTTEIRNKIWKSEYDEKNEMSYLIPKVSINATTFVKSGLRAIGTFANLFVPIILMMFTKETRGVSIILLFTVPIQFVVCLMLNFYIGKKSMETHYQSLELYNYRSDIDSLVSTAIRNNNTTALHNQYQHIQNKLSRINIRFENIFVLIASIGAFFLLLNIILASKFVSANEGRGILGMSFPIFMLGFTISDTMQSFIMFISYLTKINKGIIAKAEGEERIEKIEKIEIKELSDRKGKREVFKNYTQEIDLNKEIILIEGPSGSGKSSLMEIITLVRTPSNIEEDEYIKSGLYINGISGDNIKKESYNDLILYIKQKHPVIKYISIKTLFKIMSPGISIHEIHEYLKIVSLDDRIKDLNITPEGFSGGENQRLFIALNLSILRVKNAQIIFLDEITSSLSENQSEMILNNIITLAKEHGFIIFFITHQESLKSSSFFTISLSDPFQGIGD